MELANIDWIIIVAFLALSLGISLKYRASSGKDMKSFFLCGGKLPWYLAGISMVATRSQMRLHAYLERLGLV